MDEEQAFYESDTRDRLKVPPHTYVKRIPRKVNERKMEPNVMNE